MFSKSTMTSLPSKKLQAIVSVRNKHFKSRINLETQALEARRTPVCCRRQRKENFEKRHWANPGFRSTKLAIISTFFFLLTAFPTFKVNHQQVPQFRGQDIWYSLKAHGHVQFFLMHSPKVAILFLTFTSLK